MVMDGGVGLGHHGLGPGQAREQLIVWLLVPPAEWGYRLLGDDLIAEFHAFVADVDARPGDDLCDFVLLLVAERAAQGLWLGGAWREASGIRHAVRLSLTAGRVKVALTGRGPWASGEPKLAGRYFVFSFNWAGWASSLPSEVPEQGVSVEDYAADIASRLLRSLGRPPKAASVYSLPMLSFRFEWLVVW
jgi:hypothetical protein